MKKITIIILLINMLATIAFAQQNSFKCQNKMNFMNDEIDEYAFAFVGQIKGVQILEKNLETSSPRETVMNIKFDDKGKVTETFLSNSKIKMFGKVVYFYDADNRITKKTNYNPDGAAVSEFVYGYNSSGNLEAKTNQNATTKSIIWKTEYKYEAPESYSEYSDGKFVRLVKLKRDNKCRISETNMYKSDNILENKVTMKYDEKNNLIEQIVYSPNGTPMQKIKFEYEYDNRGNWIKQNYYEWFYENSESPYKLKKVITQTINYLNSK